MQTFVRIEATGLPAIFPAEDYYDRIFTYNRVETYGLHTVMIETKKKFQTAFDFHYDNRIVQSQIYNRYRIDLFIDETMNIELYQYAQTVYVTLKNEEVHHAKILEFNVEYISNTNLKKCSMVYADTNPKNYQHGNQPVNNYLESVYVKGTHPTSQIAVVRLSHDTWIDSEWDQYRGNYYFYSILRPFIEVTKPSGEQVDIESLKKPTKAISQKTAVQRLYLQQEQKVVLEKYAELVESFTITSPFGNFTALQPPELKIDLLDNAINLFQVDIEMIYENTVFYPYNT